MGRQTADVPPVLFAEDRPVKLLCLELLHMAQHLQILCLNLCQGPGGDYLALAELGADMGQVGAGDKTCLSALMAVLLQDSERLFIQGVFFGEIP